MVELRDQNEQLKRLSETQNFLLANECVVIQQLLAQVKTQAEEISKENSKLR